MEDRLLINKPKLFCPVILIREGECCYNSYQDEPLDLTKEKLDSKASQKKKELFISCPSSKNVSRNVERSERSYTKRKFKMGFHDHYQCYKEQHMNISSKNVSWGHDRVLNMDLRRIRIRESQRFSSRRILYPPEDKKKASHRHYNDLFSEFHKLHDDEYRYTNESDFQNAGKNRRSHVFQDGILTSVSEAKPGPKRNLTRSEKVKIFACPYCTVCCSNRGQLTGHLRIHTGERPYACPEPGCKKCFIRNEELTRHHRIHTGERPYTCSDCGKSFTRKDHLNKHKKIHVENSVYFL